MIDATVTISTPIRNPHDDVKGTHKNPQADVARLNDGNMSKVLIIWCATRDNESYESISTF